MKVQSGTWRTVFAVGLGLTAVAAAAARAAAAPTTRDLVEIADLSGLSASPDGHMAVVRVDRASVVDNGYDLAWWAVDLGGRAAPRRIASGGGALYIQAGPLEGAAPQWSADSRWFYYRALGVDGVQVWRARPDGGAAEVVTHDAADVIDFKLDPVSLAVSYHTGEPRAAVIAAEDAEYDRGVLIDGAIDPGQALYHGMRINGRMADQRLTGKWFARHGLLDGAPQHLRVREADGHVREVPDTGSWTTDPSVYAPDAETLAATGPGGTAFVKGVYAAPRLQLRRTDGTVLLCAAALCRPHTFETVAWTSAGEVLFQAHDSRLSTWLAAWNPGTGRVRRIVEASGTLSGGSIGDAPCVSAGAAAVCVAADAASPPQLVAFDLRNGKRRTLLDPSAAVRTKVAMTTETLSWTAAGRPFTAVLFRPMGVAPGRPVPLFVQYYTCEGYLRGGTGDEYPMAVLAAQGIAALCINTAGSGATPDKYDALDAYGIAVTGIGQIIDQLAARGLVDPLRVGQGGLSFGSEVTMRMLTDTRRLAAAAISSTEVEPIYWWYNRLPGRDFQTVVRRTWGLGAPDETPERWRQVSAALNAEKIAAPLLIQIPEQESRYDYELFGRLQDRKVPVEMVAFPDESHIKAQPRHKLAVYDRNLDWFRFWLQGVEDPDPAKAAQYVRWRAMKTAWRGS